MRTTPHRRAQPRRRDQRGTATVFVLGMAVVLLATAGLVIDGGKALNARMKLADDVEQAARLGANQIDIDTLRGQGEVRIDPDAARAEAGSFLSGLGYDGISVSVNGNSVSVGANDTVTTAMLQLIGVFRFDISAGATAQAVTQ